MKREDGEVVLKKRSALFCFKEGEKMKERNEEMTWTQEDLRGKKKREKEGPKMMCKRNEKGRSISWK